MSDILTWFTKRQRWYGTFSLPPPVPGENMMFDLIASGATTNMNVNGSVTAVEFEHASPTGKICIVERCNIIIQDAGVAPALFGGQAALSTGLKIEHIDADGTTVKKDFTKDITIKKNSHFGLLAGSDVPVLDSVAGNAADVVFIRWTIGKTGSPLLLNEGESFRVTVQDNLTGLEEFFWMLQGHHFDVGVFNDVAGDTTTDA